MYSKFTNLIDLNDMPVNWWNEVLELGLKIAGNPQAYSDECRGKIMATLFYEPSTRTQMSFQAAMLRLGGTIIGFDNPETSSVAKGECLKDTAKVVSSYADILVMRHNYEGSAKAAALTADCPIINAGDGGHLHPTQTLTDMLTLLKVKGRTGNLTIGLCGDLKNGRTVHSLCKALSCFKNNKFILISTKELSLPGYVKDIITANGCRYEEVINLEDAIGGLDMIYMTRIQKERFESEDVYLRQKNIFCLDKDKLNKAKDDLCILHPLPRVDEIAYDVDGDPRAMYFKQAEYGVYVRMALIIHMLKNQKPTKLLLGLDNNGIKCENPRCITKLEKYLPGSFRMNGGIPECEYCDERLK